VQVRRAVAVRNRDWATGMGSSLRVGFDALPLSAQAVVIALVDQPLIGAEAVQRLIDAWKGGAAVAVATYGGAMRNPVLIAREHFGEAGRLAVGDVGARPFLRANPGLVTLVPCDDVGDPSDIDTLDDLVRLSEGGAAASARGRGVAGDADPPPGVGPRRGDSIALPRD
jgi:CTP:molybdopterin cytidylyltransferase MocA